MNKAFRNLLLAVGVVLGLVLVINAISPNLAMGSKGPLKLSQPEFVQKVRDGQVQSLNWQGRTGEGKLVDGTRFTAELPDSNSRPAENILNLLDEKSVEWTDRGPSVGSQMLAFLAAFAIPILIFIAIIYFWRQAQSNGSQAMSFGRSRAKRVNDTGPKITFEDVAGIEEAKQELYEIVDFLRNTKKYVALGAKIPKGILLTGPPGVGKTYLARAIAGEAGVPFFHISGSDFVEMFVGVGAARVRDLFETAKAHRPCLIFVDEIDAVGRQRGAGLGGGHDEREQTLNQLLVEMDGFDANTGVIMIAATNRPDVLDPALLRPGRFDRQVVVDPPDSKGREAILRIHARGKPIDTAVDFQTVAKRTPGFSGADLANALNEAALLAARRNRSKILGEDIEEALDRVMIGPARKSRIMEQKEREVTAYHEAGHAIIGELLENSDPVHKVTILPRGFSLGSTWQLPETEKFTRSKSELNDVITTLLGGLVAEEVVFGERWTGASNDLERVTRIARAMVCEYGMSDKIGTLSVGRRSRNPFLGRDYHEERDYSEEVAKQIDDEVRSIVDRSHTRAVEILTQHRPQLDACVQALLERETLDRDEFLAVLEGRELPPIPEKVDEPVVPEPPVVGESDHAKHPAPPRLEPGPA
ncbi:MAG TPA: ATP-dependent zinc metalloprotease FtsH [Fimbriimonadaceae bacterium]|nr:ATP-dependent zinc metalloprotease FtsH [Fimbriimonadaceae bacterium]HRJ32230.1 ATP-dependent zinc metalloprotease FtsH [Fimbriimonadaceae bacterium]